jgi:hypothetical protein
LTTTKKTNNAVKATKAVTAVKPLEVHQVQYVLASDLFEGLPKLWDRFCQSEPAFSWGDNNRSLVTAESILDHCDNHPELCGSKPVESLRQRVHSLPEKGQTNVDLEN